MCSSKKLVKEWLSRHKGNDLGEDLWMTWRSPLQIWPLVCLRVSILMTMDWFTLSCSMLGSVSGFFPSCILCFLFVMLNFPGLLCFWFEYVFLLFESSGTVLVLACFYFLSRSWFLVPFFVVLVMSSCFWRFHSLFLWCWITSLVPLGSFWAIEVGCSV